MRSRRGYELACLTGLAAALGIFTAAAYGQDAGQGGLSVGLTFSEQLEHDDGDTFARSDLRLNVDSQTRAQSLSFVASAGLEKFDGTSIEDPRISLFYSRESRGAILDFSTGYRLSDIDDLSITDPLDQSLEVVDGERENFFSDLSFEFGRDAPFGATVTLGYFTTNFNDVPTFNQQDDEEINGTLRLRFNVSPVATSFINFTASDLDREGGIDVERKTIGVGIELVFSPALRGNFDIGYVSIVEDGSQPRTVDDGIFFSSSLVADRPNGTVSALLDSNIDENGRRTTIRLNRLINLPSGAISGGAGISIDGDDNDVRGLYTLDYIRELARGQFDAGFEQSFSTSSVGQETLESRARIGWRHRINDISNFNTGVVFRDSNQLGVGAVDTRQLNFDIGYDRRLTDAWSLFGGFQHIIRDSEGGTDDTQNRIFIGLRTSLVRHP